MPKTPKIPEPKPGTIALLYDDSADVQAIFATSYNVIFERRMIRVNLACLSGGQLLKGATVFLPEDMIFVNKEDTVEYFNKNKDIVPDDPTPFVPDKLDVFFGQFFAFSRHGGMSETNPIFIRLNLLATARGSVKGTAVVSINMPIEVQMGLVKSIFIDDWVKQRAQ